MGCLNISGIQISFMTENDRFPLPNHNSTTMLAIREDEEEQHWLYILHNQHWPLASETLFSTEGKAIKAALVFDLSNFIKNNATK